MNVIKEKILSIIDNTYDGILTFEVLRKNQVKFTNDICTALYSLIDDGILIKRESTDFSVEKTNNIKSKWGEQINFNERIHLKKDDYMKKISESYNYHGLKIIVYNDINSCICSKQIKTQQEGIDWFYKIYDDKTYSYEFIVV